MSTFHHFVGLWLEPDLSAVERGETSPPYIDYDAIDTRDIADTLGKFNDCGEDVTIRVPNDDVDQVTVQFRLKGRLTGNPLCEDLAAGLLSLAETSPDSNIRAPCARLYALPNRRHAPPPALPMFVVSGDFDAVMVWSQQLRMWLGIRAADIMKQIAGDVQDADHQGSLPSALAKYLGRTFAIPYKRKCVVTGLASSPGAVLTAVRAGCSPHGLRIEQARRPSFVQRFGCNAHLYIATER